MCAHRKDTPSAPGHLRGGRDLLFHASVVQLHLRLARLQPALPGLGVLRGNASNEPEVNDNPKANA